MAFRPVHSSGSHDLQRAALVCVAANAIETPRLLLNSESGRFPHGLANGNGLVGRYYTKNLNASAWGLFARPVHMNRGTTMNGTIYDESRHDSRRGFAGGYFMQGVGVGIPFLAAVSRPQAWGRDFTQYIEKYGYLSGIWLNGEDLPRAGNRISLHAVEKDQHGLPVPNVHVDEHGNDVAMRNHFYAQAERIMQAAGATQVMRGCRCRAATIWALVG